MKVFSKDLYDRKPYWQSYTRYFGDNSIAEELDGLSKGDCISKGYIKFCERNESCFIEIPDEYRKEVDIMVAKSDEVKELKRDIEILLNAYMFGKPLDKKSRNRIAERHFDIIEKQSAKDRLKKISKNK